MDDALTCAAVVMTTGRFWPWPAGRVHVTAVCVADPIGEHGAPPTVTRMLLVVPPRDEPAIVRIDPPCVAAEAGLIDEIVGAKYENKTAEFAALTWLATVTTSCNDTPSPTGDLNMIVV